LLKRKGCKTLNDLILTVKLQRKWDAAAEHLHIVKTRLFSEQKRFCFLLTQKSIFQQYYKNASESISIFHECPEFVPDSFVMECVEEQMKMAIPI
jgi:hypothetical protein